MADPSSNRAGLSNKTKNLLDNTDIKKSENNTVERQKPSVNKVRNSQTYKDITECSNKQPGKSDTAVPRCSDEESDLLVANSFRGILVHNTEYVMKNDAIETTTKPLLGQSTKQTKIVKKEFCTQIEMNTFEEGLKSTGSSIDFSVNSSMGTSNHKLNNCSKKAKDVVTEKVFIAIAHYSLVAVKSMQLFEQNLKLTPLALREIRKIEELISNMGEKNKAVMDICCKFINTFGSHVCNGNIDVGGILKTSTLYESETKLTVEKCQDLAKRAHDAYIKYMQTADAEAIFHFSDETNKETNMKVEESKLVFSCSQLSYPSMDLNHAEWLNDLLKHPGSWCVIGRGSPTGIWNILLNHRNDISDCYRIAAMLRNAWQTKWNQNPDEGLDQVVQCDISSFSDFIGRIENFLRENIVEVIEKLTCCACLNHRFKEYWSATKFVSFFQNAVSKSNELSLKHKVCLKILLVLLCQSTLNEHEDVLKWFKSPLFSCKENVFETIIHFMNNAMKPVYTDISYENAEKHWKSQVNEQITTEIAIIIRQHGDYFNDNTQCVFIARCLAKLGFDFEEMQRSYLHGDNSVDDFFIAINQETVKSSDSQDLQLEIKMIERDFFRALHISKSIYKKYNELQLYQAFVDELTNLCEKTLKEAGDQIDLGTALLIATLGFDLQWMKFSTDIDPFSYIIEEQFKIHALVWNLQNGRTFFEDLSCYHVISALNSVFIKTVETLEQEVPRCIEEAQSYIFSLLSNILAQLQNTRTKISVQRECIMLEIIVSKAFQNMKKYQLNSSGDIRILVDDMASSLNKSSKQVSIYSRPIPPNPDHFVVFLRECVLSLWRNSRIQMVNRCQSDTGHGIKVLDDFFKRELGCVCTSSLRSCLVTVPGDIRSNIVQKLCNQSTVTCKEVERILDVHESWSKWLLMSFFSVCVFSYDKAHQFSNSASSAFQETFGKESKFK